MNLTGRFPVCRPRCTAADRQAPGQIVEDPSDAPLMQPRARGDLGQR